jgi:F-type H+-transporting ATPase subunit delta
MKNQKLASRYASSLLSLASDQNCLEEVYADMQYIDLLTKESKEFDIFLNSPIIKSRKKIKILNTILKGQVNDLTEKFIELLIKNNRELYLHDVVSSFLGLYDLKKNIKTAYITTAQPLSAENIKRLKEITKLIKADSVKIVQIIDENIIGGFKLNVDDYQIDASIGSKLKELRRDFAKNTYLSEL